MFHTFRTVFLFTLFSFAIADSQVQRLVWFTQSPADPVTNLIGIPEKGFCTYASRESFSKGDDRSALKEYYTFFKGFSRFSRKMVLICQSGQRDTQCQIKTYGEDTFMNSQISKEQQVSLFGLDQERRIMIVTNLKNGQQTSYGLKEQYIVREIIGYSVSILVLLLVFCTMQFNPIFAMSHQSFVLQFYLTALYYVTAQGEYIRQSIEDWQAESWKFWIIFPIILVSYKIMEGIVGGMLKKQISIAMFSKILAFNGMLIFFSIENFLFVLVSGISLYLHRLDQSKNLQIFLNNNKSNIFQFLLYFALFSINLSFTLTNSIIYLGLDTPVSIFVTLFVCFSQFLIKVCLWIASKRQLAKEEEKCFVKILAKKEDLSSSFTLNSISQHIQHQCPICYQKMTQRIAQTPCGHFFHQQCITKWVEKSQSCPIDRIRIKIRPKATEYAK